VLRDVLALLQGCPGGGEWHAWNTHGVHTHHRGSVRGWGTHGVHTHHRGSVRGGGAIISRAGSSCTWRPGGGGDETNQVADWRQARRWIY